jgi:hypothetical protein
MTLPEANPVAWCVGVAQDVVFHLTATASGNVYSWTDLRSTIPAADVVDAIFFGVGGLVALSENGRVWKNEPSWSAEATLAANDCIAMERNRSHIAYVLTRSGVVFESHDRGYSWQLQSSIPIADAVDIAWHADDLFVLTEAGVVWQRSTGGSSSWSAVGALARNDMSSLAADINGLYVASRTGDIAVSANGASWTWVGTVGASDVVALATMDTPTDVMPVDSLHFSVGAPWPNPLTHGQDTLALPVMLAEAGTVRLELFDARGRRIAPGRAQRLPAGISLLRWQALHVPSGVYFARLQHASGERITLRWGIAR